MEVISIFLSIFIDFYPIQASKIGTPQSLRSKGWQPNLSHTDYFSWLARMQIHASSTGMNALRLHGWGGGIRLPDVFESILKTDRINSTRNDTIAQHKLSNATPDAGPSPATNPAAVGAIAAPSICKAGI